jgi:hypothetical protein
MAVYGLPALYERLIVIGGPALFYFFSYICGTFDVYNLMPLIVVTFSYYIYLRGISDFFSKNNINNIYIVTITLIWIFSTLSYPFIMTNIRQPLSVACVFTVLINPEMSKKNIVIFLVTAFLFHVTGTLMAACLLLAFLWEKKQFKNLFLGLLVLLAVGLWLNFSGYNLGIEHKIDTYLKFQKVDKYTFDNFWKYVTLSYLNMILFLALAFQVFRKKKFSDIKNNIICKFSLIFFGICLLFFNNLIVFQRLMFYLPLFSIAMISGYLTLAKKNIYYYFTLSILIFTIAYAIRLQYANFGGHEYWPGIYYRDVLSTLILAKNYFFVKF